MIRTALLAFLICLSAEPAPSPPENLRPYLAEIEAARVQEMRDTESLIKQAKMEAEQLKKARVLIADKGKKQDPGTFPSGEAKRDAIDAARNRVRALEQHLVEVTKNDPPFVPRLNLWRRNDLIKVGEIGRIGCPEGSNPGLPRNTYGKFGGPRGLHVVQSEPGFGVLVEARGEWLTPAGYPSKGYLIEETTINSFIIDGVSTKGHATGTTFDPGQQIFAVVGTRTWGTETLFVIKPVAIEEYLAPPPAPAPSSP